MPGRLRFGSTASLVRSMQVTITNQSNSYIFDEKNIFSIENINIISSLICMIYLHQGFQARKFTKCLTMIFGVHEKWRARGTKAPENARKCWKMREMGIICL